MILIKNQLFYRIALTNLASVVEIIVLAKNSSTQDSFGHPILVNEVKLFGLLRIDVCPDEGHLPPFRVVKSANRDACFNISLRIAQSRNS